jgi:hypothetical protein
VTATAVRFHVTRRALTEMRLVTTVALNEEGTTRRAMPIASSSLAFLGWPNGRPAAVLELYRR